MEQKEGINMSIDEGDQFFAHEMSINFNPMQFILDFRSVTPRNDPRSSPGKPSLLVKHNVVMLDPWHMLQAKKLIERMVGAYEKEFGKIEKPESVNKFEKKRRKVAEDKKDATTDVPNYFG